MKTMEDIRRQGMEALARELGPVGMALGGPNKSQMRG